MARAFIFQSFLHRRADGEAPALSRNSGRPRHTTAVAYGLLASSRLDNAGVRQPTPIWQLETAAIASNCQQRALAESGADEASCRRHRASRPAELRLARRHGECACITRASSIPRHAQRLDRHLIYPGGVMRNMQRPSDAPSEIFHGSPAAISMPSNKRVAPAGAARQRADQYASSTSARRLVSSINTRRPPGRCRQATATRRSSGTSDSPICRRFHRAGESPGGIDRTSSIPEQPGIAAPVIKCNSALFPQPPATSSASPAIAGDEFRAVPVPAAKRRSVHGCFQQPFTLASVLRQSHAGSHVMP